jgi:hypothetical protein
MMTMTMMIGSSGNGKDNGSDGNDDDGNDKENGNNDKDEMPLPPCPFTI